MLGVWLWREFRSVSSQPASPTWCFLFSALSFCCCCGCCVFWLRLLREGRREGYCVIVAAVLSFCCPNEAVRLREWSGARVRDLFGLTK